MKNLLIFIVIFLGAWQFFLKDNTQVESTKKKAVAEFKSSAAMQTLAKAKELTKPKVVYKCDGRQYCSQMTSFEEAKYFIQHCPNTKMDVDNDGIACEKQFNK
ncbi:MAG: excalibur calcium-binding domain-containing protein [Colwellia sp.]|nr:excalibur calcium-binding domain-containing protein [Colwellia sp.]